MTSVKLWNYYRGEINDDANENNASRIKINNNRTTTSKFYKYRTKVMGNTTNNNNKLDAEVAVPLKCLSNFWGNISSK